VLDLLLQTESVQETATRLGRSQSAISHRLAVIREQLGDEILVKRGRGMIPTVFAYRIRSRVRAIMQAIDDLLSSRFSDPTLTQEPPLERLRLPAHVDVVALLQFLEQMGHDGPVAIIMPPT
jgi:DNA-binding transcriptional LysR family regulator